MLNQIPKHYSAEEIIKFWEENEALPRLTRANAQEVYYELLSLKKPTGTALLDALRDRC